MVVNPGTTQHGNPYDTCCRECSKNPNNHSNECKARNKNTQSQVTNTRSQVTNTTCKVGCGRSVNPQNTSSGRPYDTCCQECSNNHNHSNECKARNKNTQSQARNKNTQSQVRNTTCKVGCGRSVNPQTTSSSHPYDTCCQECTKNINKHNHDCATRNRIPNVQPTHSTDPNKTILHKKERQQRINSNKETLYHQTDEEGWRGIQSSSYQMKRGNSDGLCGSGIYFAVSPQETELKAHHKGVMLKCVVKLGNIKYLGNNGDKTIKFRKLLKDGYDSVQITRASGKEYVVYNYDQTEGIHRIPW